MKHGPEAELIDDRPKKKAKSLIERLKHYFIAEEKSTEECENEKNPIGQLPSELLVHIFRLTQGTDEYLPLPLREVNRTWNDTYQYCLSQQMHQQMGLMTLYRAKGIINRLMGWTEGTQHLLTTETGSIALFEEQQRKIKHFEQNKSKILDKVSNDDAVQQAFILLENIPKGHYASALLLRSKALDLLNNRIIQQRIRERINDEKKVFYERNLVFLLNNCYLTDFPASVIADPALSFFWSNLTRLNLEGIGLKILPDNIGTLKKLKMIFLTANELSSLPASFEELRELNVLDLRCNRFTILPEIICQLEMLDKLWFFGNQLTTLPLQIGNLKNLKNLGFSSNRLTVLPSSICQLTSLEYLTLYNNFLTELPAGLEKLPNLKALDLERNCLNNIPNGLERLLERSNIRKTKKEVLATQCPAVESSKLSMT